MNMKYVLLLLAISPVLVNSSVVAAQKSQSSSDKSAMDKLEDDGFSCGKVVAGYYSCEKTGENDHVCTDREHCEEMPGTAIIRSNSTYKGSMIKDKAILRQKVRIDRSM